jgi:hypothetical protein
VPDPLLYDDALGGLPPDWAPDPAWAPPASWGYPTPGAPVVAPAPDVVPAPIDVAAVDPALAAPMVPPPELAAAAPPDLAIPAAAPAIPEAAGFAPPAALPPPAPGSISGGTFDLPLEPIGAEQLDVAPTTLADGWARDPLSNPDPTAIDNIAMTDPVGFAQLQIDQEGAKAARQAAERIRIEEEAVRSLRRDQEARKRADAATQAKSDQIVADAIALASRSPDPDRYMKNRSTGQKVTDILAAVVGGLVSGRTGGPNVGLQLFQQKIDRDIAAQVADVEGQRYALGIRKGAVAEEFARTGNLAQAADTVRLATYEAAINVLAAEQQNFDPRGTAALKRGQFIQKLQAQRAASAEQMRQQIFKESLDLEKFVLDREQFAEVKRNNRDTSAREWTKLGMERDKAKMDATVFQPDQLGILHPGLPVPKIPMSLGQYEKWLETNKTGEQLKTAARANDPDEINRELAVAGIVDDKGAPVRFRKPEFAAAVAESLEIADEIARLTDGLMSMVAKNGWSSGFMKSTEWRNAMQNYNEIVIRKKEQDKLGVITGPDLEIVQREIGTDDPTEMRPEKVLDALKHFRNNQIEGFNTKLRAQANVPGGKVKRWEPPPWVDPRTVPQTAEESRLQRLLTAEDKPLNKEIETELRKRLLDAGKLDAIKPRPEPAGPQRDEIGRLRPGGAAAMPDVPYLRAQRPVADADLSDPEVARIYEQTVTDIRKRHAPDATIEQQDELRQLGIAARGPAEDPTAASARETLFAVSQSATSAALRLVARRALDEALAAGRGPPEEGTPLRVQGAAQEGLPLPASGGL